MNIEYDKEIDAAFIWFFPEIDKNSKNIIKNEIWPYELKEHIGLLFGENNKLIGLEILFATEYLPEKLLKNE